MGHKGGVRGWGIGVGQRVLSPLFSASSDEEDEDIFSDDHIGSDSESGDNEQVRGGHNHCQTLVIAICWPVYVAILWLQEEIQGERQYGGFYIRPYYCARLVFSLSHLRP